MKIEPRMDTNSHELTVNYLRITGMRVGVIINFKRAKLEWRRVVL